MANDFFGYAQQPSMFEGQPYEQTFGHDFRGVPGMDSPFAALAMTVAQPFMSQWFGDAGYVPGAWLPNQNMFDRFRKQQFTEAHTAVMRQAAEMDRAQFMRTARGIANLTGTPWGDAQRDAAGVWSSSLAQMAPMLSMVWPEALETLAGPRGSAVNLSRFAHLGGRYATDPVSGKLGMSPDTVSAITREISQTYQTPEGLASMKGVSQGQAGQLLDELQRRGFGMTTSPESRAAQMLGKAPGSITPDSLRTMFAENPALENQLRGFDATQIKSRIQNMTSAVAAMREIFGELGRPNAPMVELVNGLQMLTQGGLATMAPGRIEQTVRQTWQLAKQAGVGIETVNQMTQLASQQADSRGLPREFVPQAVQGALAFGAAYGSVGGGETPIWGRLDKEQYMLKDQALRISAADSVLGKQLGATVRLLDQAKEAGKLREGTTGAALAEALHNDKTEFVDPVTGKTRSVYMRFPEWQQAVSEASGGMFSPGQVATAREQPRNLEYLHQIGGADIVRRLQGEVDLMPIVAAGFGGAISQRFRGLGMSDQSVRRIRGEAGRAAAKTLFELPSAVLANADERNAAVADAISKVVQDANLPPEELGKVQREQLLGVAEIGYGIAEKTAMLDPRLRYPSLIQGIDLHRKETGVAQQRIREQARSEAAVRQLFSGLNSFGPVQRVIRGIEEAEPGTTPTQLIAQAFGFQSAKEVDKTVTANFQQLIKYRQEYEKLDPSRPEDKQRMSDLLKEMEPIIKEVRGFAAERGISIDVPFSKGEAASAVAGLTGFSEQAELITSRQLTGAPRDDYVASPQGQNFITRGRSATARASTLLYGVLDSDASMKAIGSGGRAKLDDLVSKFEKMRDIESEFSKDLGPSGILGGLVDMPQAARAEYLQINKQVREGMKELSGTLEQQPGGKEEIDDDTRERDIAGIRRKHESSPQDVINKLTRLFGDVAAPDKAKLLEALPGRAPQLSKRLDDISRLFELRRTDDRTYDQSQELGRLERGDAGKWVKGLVHEGALDVPGLLEKIKTEIPKRETDEDRENAQASNKITLEGNLHITGSSGELVASGRRGSTPGQT